MKTAIKTRKYKNILSKQMHVYMSKRYRFAINHYPPARKCIDGEERAEAVSKVGVILGDGVVPQE